MDLVYILKRSLRPLCEEINVEPGGQLGGSTLGRGDQGLYQAGSSGQMHD